MSMNSEKITQNKSKKSEIGNYLVEKGFTEIETDVFEKIDVDYRTISINGDTQHIPSKKIFTFKLEEGAWIGNSEEDNTPLVQISFLFNKNEQDMILVESLEDFKKFINI